MNRLVLFFFSLAVGMLGAQEASEEAVRLRTLVLEPLPQETLHLQLGERNSQEIKVKSGGLSHPQELMVTVDQLSFYGKPLGEGEEPSSPKLICQANVPNKSKDLLAIFIVSTSAKNTSKVEVRVFDISDKVWPEGETLVVNYLNSNVRFRLGEFNKGIRAGKNLFVDAPTDKTEFNMARVIFEAQASDQSWKSFRKTSLRYTDQIRYLMVSHYKKKSQRPALQVYRVKL